MSGLATATLVSPATVLASCTPNKKDEKSSVTLNLCLQEGITPGETLAEKLDFMEANGITGIEVGGRGLSNRVDELNDALKNRNIKVGAICAGFDGFILAEDEQKTAFDNTMREIVEAAGKIGSCGVIMVPAFNGQQPCKPHTRETREFLCQQMHDLGEFALQHGTTVILEPLNRNEAHYLRQVADAAAICRDSNSEGVKCMGDFWHMQEETSDYAAFMAAGKKYLPNPLGTPCDDVWDIPIINPMSNERVGYPTQKPLALLTRIVSALSNEGDLVGDFFCGSGTTLVAAKKLNRRYFGCDRSPVAIETATARLNQ